MKDSIDMHAFSERVSSLLNDLRSDLNIDLDFSFVELDQVEQFARSSNNDDLDDRIYVYLGEFCRRFLGGAWVKGHVEGDSTFGEWIIDGARDGNNDSLPRYSPREQIKRLDKKPAGLWRKTFESLAEEINF